MSVYLGTTKVQLKSAVAGNGPQPTPSPATYEDVCKEVDFCKQVFQQQGGKSTYAGAWIGLRYSGIDYENFTLGSSNVVAVRTSDGAFYSYANDGASVTHHWDSSKDFDIEGIQTEHKFNWVIYYFSENNIVSNSSHLDCYKAVNIVYVFDMDLKFYSVTSAYSHNSYGLCRNNDILQSFDFIDNHRCYGNTSADFSHFCNGCFSLTKLPDNLDTSSGTNFALFCYQCYALAKLPDNLDTSSGTNFQSFCADCRALAKLPDNLDTSSGTNFPFFCAGCFSLTKLPDSFDISSGTNFTGFCQDCRYLTKLPDSLDTSSGTSFESFFNQCYALTKLPDSLDTSSGTKFSSFFDRCYALTKANIILPAAYNITTLSYSNKLTVASMRYIADHAPTTSGHTLTIGSTNIERANAYDPTIITTLTEKGWTVN